MNIVSKYFNFIKKLYREEESGLALALFRIAYGLVVFAEVYQIFYFRHLIFDPIPYVQESVYMISPMLILWLIAIFLIIIGFLTKTAVWLNYLFTVLFLGFAFYIGSASEHNYHIDKEFIPVGLVLLFMPISRRLSIDNLIDKIRYSSITSEYKPKTTVSRLNYIVLILVAGLIYFDSIFYKLYSPMWLEGLGVWLPSSLPWATYLDLSFILNNKYIILFLGYLTLFFQLTYIFLIWIERIKTFYLIVGIFLHIGIAFAFPIPWFALAMVALYIGLVPSSFYHNFYERFIKKDKNPTLIFFFDKYCPLCNRLRIIVEFFDNGRNITFLSVQDEAYKNDLLKDIKEKSLLDNVYSVNNKGKLFKGIESYHEMMKRVWILKIFALLMYVPFIKLLGSKIYSYIATHRIQYSCNEERCSIGSVSYRHKEKIDDSQIKILQNLSLEHLKVGILAGFIFYIVFSQFIMLQSSLLVNHFYKSISLPYWVINDMSRKVNTYKEFFYPYTGVSNHAVFMDGHFKNYNHTVAVVYKGKNKEIFLPIINEKGQASFYNSGRQWVNYSFRVSNRNFKDEQYIKGVQKYIYFWAYKNNINLKNATFLLKYKYNKVPYKWEKNLLKKSLEKPWKDAGKLGWKNGVFYSNIIDIEKQIQ